MTFYHGTRRTRLPSIHQNGLGGAGSERQLWDGCTRGVYLAARPEICMYILLEQYLTFGAQDSHPPTELAEMIIIVIDDTRIDPRRLGPDPEIDRSDVWLYSGIIDVTNMPVISVDDLITSWKISNS